MKYFFDDAMMACDVSAVWGGTECFITGKA